MSEFDEFEYMSEVDEKRDLCKKAKALANKMSEQGKPATVIAEEVANFIDPFGALRRAGLLDVVIVKDKEVKA